MTKFGMVFLMLATLLASCSDSEKTKSEQSVTADSVKVDSEQSVTSDSAKVDSEQSVAPDSAKVDSDALAPVQIGGKWGYINKAGEIVIKPQFYSALDFS